jgi:hypothetical protein
MFLNSRSSFKEESTWAILKNDALVVVTDLLVLDCADPQKCQSLIRHPSLAELDKSNFTSRLVFEFSRTLRTAIANA